MRTSDGKLCSDEKLECDGKLCVVMRSLSVMRSCVCSDEKSECDAKLCV